MGYTCIDTAAAYCNERAVGRGMRASGLAREDIFLSTKLWPCDYENEKAVQETLERLGTDYVDLLYIHQPAENWLAIGCWKKPIKTARQRPLVFPILRGNTWRSWKQNGRLYPSSSRWRLIRILRRENSAQSWIHTALS